MKTRLSPQRSAMSGKIMKKKVKKTKVDKEVRLISSGCVLISSAHLPLEGHQQEITVGVSQHYHVISASLVAFNTLLYQFPLSLSSGMSYGYLVCVNKMSE